jgi:hypothetical protein
MHHETSTRARSEVTAHLLQCNPVILTVLLAWCAPDLQLTTCVCSHKGSPSHNCAQDPSFLARCSVNRFVFTFNDNLISVSASIHVKEEHRLQQERRFLILLADSELAANEQPGPGNDSLLRPNTAPQYAVCLTVAGIRVLIKRGQVRRCHPNTCSLARTGCTGLRVRVCCPSFSVSVSAWCRLLSRPSSFWSVNVGHVHTCRCDCCEGTILSM